MSDIRGIYYAHNKRNALRRDSCNSGILYYFNNRGIYMNNDEKTKTFKTKEQLLAQIEIDESFYGAEKEWCIRQNSLEDIFKNCPLSWRVWAIRYGYEQFIDNCKWNELSSGQLASILIRQPQLAKYCDWDKLENDEWISLLEYQPQFSEYCDWSKLEGYDWSYLLRRQPQFAKYCEWDKLDRNAWISLLISKNRPHCYPSTDKLTSSDWDFIIRWTVQRDLKNFT